MWNRCEPGLSSRLTRLDPSLKAKFAALNAILVVVPRQSSVGTRPIGLSKLILTHPYLSSMPLELQSPTQPQQTVRCSMSALVEKRKSFMSAKALKLYNASASPNCRRVRMFLAEKHISISLVPVDLGAGEQHSDAYCAVNSRRVVPTLVLCDGTAIGEVPAIWRYLEEAFTEVSLLGTDAKEKAIITMWERRVELDGFAAVMEGVRNAIERLKGRAIAGPHDYEQIPAIVERSKLRVANFYDDLDARLATSNFVAGERFSAADITALVTVDFATKGMNTPIASRHSAIKRWYDSVSSRPSAAS
jgi:glutathione S-transferase